MTENNEPAGCMEIFLMMLVSIAIVWVFIAILSWLDQRIKTLEQFHDIPSPALSLLPEDEEKK